MIVVMLQDDGKSFKVHHVDDVTQAVEDITKEYQLVFFPLDDGDPENLVAGFHTGRRIRRDDPVWSKANPPRGG